MFAGKGPTHPSDCLEIATTGQRHGPRIKLLAVAYVVMTTKNEAALVRQRTTFSCRIKSRDYIGTDGWTARMAS
jgi:hypothetical protein